ncbi:MAG TPA: hypothetical protein VJV77_08860 [Casimicrobiaceae bacterium]|nr:hypothetical protein [Casimicrobiaceae bacterium]
MDMRIPELDPPGNAASITAAESESKRDEESRAQQAALEELADRINAARSIV